VHLGIPFRPRPATGPRRGLTYRMVTTGGVMAILLTGLFTLLYTAITDLDGAVRGASRSEAVLACGHRLEKLVVDLEVDSRAYVLTGQPRFLRSYEAARAAIPGQAAAFDRVSAKENADQSRRARQIIQADDAYLHGYSVPLMNTERVDHAAARTRTLSGEGLELLTPLLDRFATFENVQRGIATVREERARGAARRAAVTAAAAAVGSPLLIWFFVSYLMTAMVRPVRRASVMAGELAEGDLTVRMPETSPGEIGALERVFNAMAGSLEASRDELHQNAEEQRALRHVATLVARGVSSSHVLAAIAGELGRVLKADHTHIVRFDSDGMGTIVADWTDPAVPAITRPATGRFKLEEGTLAAEVLRTGLPARVPDYGAPTNAIGRWRRRNRIRYAVGCPVKVEGRIWGQVVLLTGAKEPECGVTEDRMLEFVELIGTAIANAQARSDLLASRARVVAASDESRRRIERNLHDGAQQQLVTLALRLRAAGTAIAPCQQRLQQHLSGTVEELTYLLEGLQEISRGILPPTLTRNGLCPALKFLARRSPVPVTLDVRLGARLPPPVEVAIYYTVSEALTNVAKHAHASTVKVCLTRQEATVHLMIRDDGRGGAHLTGGSGLLGLKDRVEALSGRIEVISPAGGGTTLLVCIPAEPR
jgi:signal transduction histidine kinase